MKALADFVNAEKRITGLKKATSSPFDLGNLATAEGAVTAQLFTLPSKMFKSENNRPFNKWLFNLLVAGIAIDTAIDLPEDYEVGITRVAPTMPNRLVVLSKGIVPSSKLLRGTNPRLIRSLMSSVSAVRDDREKDLAA